jgi:hypothetical protein
MGIRVVPRQPRVGVVVRASASPALVDEWLPLTVTLRNGEDTAVVAVLDAEVRAAPDSKGIPTPHDGAPRAQTRA